MEAVSRWIQTAQLPRPLIAPRRQAVAWLLGLAVALPFATSLVAAGFVWNGQQQVSAGMASATTALEIQRSSQTLLALILDLQSSQRGYVLTAAPSFLEPYEAARAQLPVQLGVLAQLVTGHPEQVARVQELQAIATERAAVAADVIATVAAGRREEALSAVESGRGKRLTDQARLLLADIDREEGRFVVARQATLARDGRRQARALGALVVASTLTLVALMTVLRRLVAYEEIVRMCAWSRTIEYQGHWMSFEQYLQQRFGLQTSHGISPDAARQVRERTEAEDVSAGAGTPGNAP